MQAPLAAKGLRYLLCELVKENTIVEKMNRYKELCEQETKNDVLNNE
jgi:hypothetical protein